MKKKAIIFGVFVIFLLMTAAAIYCLTELLRLNFIMAFLTVTSIASSIIAVVMFLLRDKLYSGLKKLSKDRKERLLNNYMRQFKLYRFILWLSPSYVLAIIGVYYVRPGQICR